MLCDEIRKEDVARLKGDYVFSIKYDGVRAFIYIENGIIAKIINRRGFDITRQFIEFNDIRFNFKSGVLDSEIIVENGKLGGDFNEGISFRTHLKNDREISERAERLKAKIVAFDIIELNGENLRFKPLSVRLQILKENVRNGDLLCCAETYEDFKQIWDLVEKEKLEGVIAKHKNTAYEGVRSKYWLKIKNWKEMVVEFCGYEVAVSGVGGYYKGITLKDDVGGVGVRCACMGKQSEEVKEIIETQGKVKCVVQYLEVTKDDKMRFVSFRGLAK
jgi:bifunctional non-homologous end joining protein LigD